ncbi:MAG: ATP-binding protein [Acidimicrobiales bacterium]
MRLVTPHRRALRDHRAVRFDFEEFHLDEERYTLSGPAGVVHVEPQVFDVLLYLVTHRDRVVTKEELLDAVWGSRFVSESALTTRIRAARRAVGDDGQAQRVIKNVHGRGYQFIAEVRRAEVRHRGTLPRLRNAPIGRDVDIKHVTERLRDAPLLTITGPGGIGKTTVALAVAHGLAGEYGDGVVFVDLSPVPPRADVTRAVADAAGVNGAASETLEGVADHLSSRPVLLVLDNCEHVLDRAAALADRMLERRATARILATSREPLGVGSEHVWPLGPLIDDGPALFVERAWAAEPRVDWDPAHPAVIELCRRLDGVPLAIELAAGQLRRFDLDELNQRLDDRLTLLSARAVGDGHRHATMEQAISWSFQLLDEDEQRLLRHLGVFPSTFDVSAVEETAPPMSSVLVLVFGQLVDKSLVVRVPGSGGYRLLETIRLFAQDRLEECRETAPAFERHRRHVRDRTAMTSRLDRWMSARLGAAFRARRDDARQAFGLSVHGDDGHGALEIAIGASFLWKNALGCAEGDRWVEDLLGLDLPPHDQAWAHILRSDIGLGRGDHRQMFGAAALAGVLAERGGDLAAGCLAATYTGLTQLTDVTQRPARLGTALDLAYQSGDPRLVVLVESFLAGANLTAGRHDEARSAIARRRRSASDDGYDRFILNWAGWLLGLVERDGAAARHWMDVQQDFLDRSGIVETWLSSFSTAMCDVIDGGDVTTTLGRTLDLAEWEGYQAAADCVLVLAYAELCSGRLEAAAELVGSAKHGRFNTTAHYAVYRAVLDRPLRQNLDRTTLMRAMVRGRQRKPAHVLAEYGVARG